MSIRNDVSKALKKLVVEDMIERPTYPVDFASSVISMNCVHPKENGGTRICVDMRAANQATEGERHGYANAF